MKLIPYEEIDSIRKRRNDLEKDHSVFSHLDFKEAFAQSYQDRLYFAITQNSESQVDTIIPLQFRKGTIEFWNTPRSDYNEVLGDSMIPIRFDDLKEVLKNEFGNIDFGLKDMPFKYFSQSQYSTENIYKLLVDQSYLDSINSRSKRTYIRRMLRHCERDGLALNLQSYTRSEDIKKLLPKLFELHFKKRDDTKTPSQFHDQRNINLYFRLAEAETIGTQMDVLYANNQVMAMHFGFQKQGTIYFYKYIFDTDFCKYSPGFLLQYFIVNSHSGCQTFDLLRGEESYKKKVSNIFTSNYALI